MIGVPLHLPSAIICPCNDQNKTNQSYTHTMAPSNPSMLSPSPSPAGTIVSPLTSTSTSTTTNASAQGESSAGDYTKITSQTNNSGPGRSGRWTPDEKLLFLHGLKLHGRGRWKKIRYYLPTRYVTMCM